jgi:hypothetical protein
MADPSDVLTDCWDSTNHAHKTIATNINGTAVSTLGTANTELAVTIAAAAGVKHHLTDLVVTVSAAATEAAAKTITITDDSTVVYAIDVPISQAIGTKLVDRVFSVPITSAAVNKNMVITVAALGANSKARVSYVNYDAA